MTGTVLAALILPLGLPIAPAPVLIGLIIAIASISFAARGALFARSAGDKGWLVATGIVAGEAAILMTAALRPDSLPDWLLALLPAQWASLAIQAAFRGAGAKSGVAALVALAGTAAATALVASLWPRRWPYVIMLSTWLAASAIVWNTL